MISETKSDENFQGGQFLMDGFTLPYATDRNTNGGGKAHYARENISSMMLW